MTDLTHLPHHRTSRAAARRLSSDGVIAAYIHELAAHQGPRERGPAAEVAGVASRPRPRVATGRGTKGRCTA